MSELNIAAASAGYNGIKQENSVESLLEVAVGSSKSVNLETRELKNERQNDEELNDVTSTSKTALTAKEVNETVEELNSFLQDMKRNLSFTVDEKLGESVIVVKDTESDEVIRQIPSEELVVLRKKMDDVAGILFDTKV